MLKFFVKFIQALNSNSHPGEIAHAVCLGMLLGFLPKDNIFWYIITIFILFMRINKAALALSTLAFTFIAPLFDLIFDSIGWTVLTAKPLVSTFVLLLDIPFVGFTKFNNTIAAGSLLCGLVLYIPVYFLMKAFVWLSRNKIVPVMRKTKFIKVISKANFVKKVTALATKNN